MNLLLNTTFCHMTDSVKENRGQAIANKSTKITGEC